MAKRKPWRLITVAALLGVLGYAGYVRFAGSPEVEVATLSESDIAVEFTAEGFVRGKEYPLSPEVQGRVVQVMVQEGDRVTAGQLLFKLDDTDARAALRQSEAAVRAARNATNQAEMQVVLVREQSAARITALEARVRAARIRYEEARAGPRPQEVEQARHRLEQARAAAREAKQALARAEELYREGAISRALLESAQAKARIAQASADEAEDALLLLTSGTRSEEVRVASAQVEAAQAELNAERSASREISMRREALLSARRQVEQAQAEADRARSLLAKSAVGSPVEGVVSRLAIEPGLLASPGSPAVVVSTRRDLHVEAEISSEDAAKVREGMEVTVTSAALPGEKFRAKVARLSPIGEIKPDAAIRTRIVRARVTLPVDEPRLKPGMEVDVEGRLVLRRGLVVPNAAILFRPEGPAAYVVENATASLRRIELGVSTADSTEVLAGLRAGERVVVDGKEPLTEGRRVRVKE